MADEIEAVAVFKQFGVDQGSGNVKVIIAARDLAWSTAAKPMQKYMSLVRIPVNCCADTDEVVYKYCFVHWVRGARHNKAAGELIGRLVKTRPGIIV